MPCIAPDNEGSTLTTQLLHPGHGAHPSHRHTSRPATRLDTHKRVRTDRVDQAGSITCATKDALHHIGVGRIHYRTRVLILAQDLNIRIINAATGELLRDFTLDPTRDYQPTGAPKGPTRRRFLGVVATLPWCLGG
jgi:hypothetical protein